MTYWSIVSSRFNIGKRDLMSLWGPFQLAIILILGLIDIRNMVDTNNGGKIATPSGPFAKQIEKCTFISQSYLMLMVMRDCFAMFIQLVQEYKQGFWDAVTLHIVSIPLDCIMCSIVTTWVLQIQYLSATQSEISTEATDISGQNINVLSIELLLSLSLICFNLFIKWISFLSFMYCMGG